MDVMVIGAGIGGLAVTHGLLADGHRVRVLERRGGPSTGGAAVTIYSNGASALAGLDVRIEDLGAPIEGLRIVRADGRVLMRTNFAPLVQRSGFGVRTIPRAALVHRLADTLPPGVVHYAAAVERVDVTSGRPVVELTTDAMAARKGGGAADVVIGADGYCSVVRHDVLDAAPARDAGWATWQGLSAVLPDVAASQTGLLVVGDAGLVGMMPAGDGLVQWWFDVPWSPSNPALGSPHGWLRERFGGYCAPVADLLDSITDSELGLYPHVVHTVPDVWGFGAVTLLGDAAHAFPPSQAQGANQALEDAWALRRALLEGGEPTRALRSYEACRAPRVRRISRLAESERTNRPPSTLLAIVARLTPVSVGSRAYARLIRSVSNVLNDGGPAPAPAPAR
jgi:FAD-dependent urate hydroxylase